MHTIFSVDGKWAVAFVYNHTIPSEKHDIANDLTFDEAAELCSYLNGGLPSAKRMLEILEELERASRSVATV